MITPLRRIRGLLLTAVVTAGTLILSTQATSRAEQSLFFEETAQACWSVPHECPDGSIVDATLLVASTRDFFSPDREDPDPTVRVQYQAICPDGSSYSWIGFLPATITSDPNLKTVHVTASGTVRDIFDASHLVTVDVTWTAVGPLVTSVNGPRSTRKQREAAATGQVTFDGVILVDGPANHPTRPAPFIRTDTER
jgi:hypothetical protein